MELRGLLVCQEYTRVVIKLDDDDRALDAEVKCVIVAKSTNPAEIRLMEPGPHLIQADVARPLGEIQEILRDNMDH